MLGDEWRNEYEGVTPSPYPPTPLLGLQGGGTASMWAAAEGHLEALRTLLAAGANEAAAAKVRRTKRSALWLEARSL